MFFGNSSDLLLTNFSGPISPYSSPETPNYTYKSNTSGRDASSVPRRHIDYPTPNNPSILGPRVPPPQPAEFRSCLSTRAQEFVTINQGDYAGCEKYMKQNPEILDEDEEDLLEEAFAAMTVGKESYAMCCVQQSLLLRDCRKMTSGNDREDYFTGLIEQENQAMLRFFRDRDQEMTRLQSRVQNSSHRPTSQGTDLTSSLGGLSFTEPPGRHSSGYLGPPFSNPQRESFTGNNFRNRAGAANRHPTVSSASDASTYLGAGSVAEAIDDRYRVRDNGTKFFTFGRVFATLWHSGTGISKQDPKRGDQVKPGRFGEPIHSKIQRMAVVKEDHGFCWCIPINTYNGKGVGKPGFNDRDIRAHAIIYMAGCPSEEAKGEPKMSKKPIEVNSAGPDQKLDPMSRIHFGKVHTVEHNVKVMNVGNITKKSLEYFEAYWNSKAEEENRRPK
jgi:hypothetical protein